MYHKMCENSPENSREILRILSTSCYWGDTGENNRSETAGRLGSMERTRCRMPQQRHEST